ncbi:MAG: hypothetical protein JJ863_24875 [Deltaproteobacteria bacterium]|nr:hypothetical protein [Deltaproteobacteria bacterium]
MRVLPLLLLIACSGTESSTESTEAPSSDEPSAESPGPAGPEPADPCPVLTAAASSAQGGGVEPSVNGEDIPIDLDALAAALPETAAGLPREDVSTWNRGMAGHWSPGVMTTYLHEGQSVGVEIDDLVHVCSCDSGMGSALQNRRLRRIDGAGAIEIAGNPAVTAEPAGRPAELEVWVNDRCSVRLWAAPLGVLQSLARAFDWAALAAACPARPT